MRTIIEIPDTVAESLDHLCRMEKRSRVGIIREALTDYLAKKSQTGNEAAFGLWKNENRDGLDYQTALREEWSER